MALERLTRSEWRPYFDRVSRALADARAELEVVALGIGDHVEASWLRLYGITYDGRSDVLEIALEGIDHLVTSPRDVFVEETARGLVAVEIVTDDETRQIVQLREPIPISRGEAHRRPHLPT